MKRLWNRFICVIRGHDKRLLFLDYGTEEFFAVEVRLRVNHGLCRCRRCGRIVK